MIPVKLQIHGFLSYQDPVEIDFSGFDLACISGANGAGKSSLLDAITWVLFGSARRNDDSIINTRSDTARVVLVFQYEEETYRVERQKSKNKTGSLEFTVQTKSGGWNILTSESIRATEARICQTLRMDYETFINASFFLQGKADQFAQQRPADRKRILGSILGLERWAAYQEEAGRRKKQVQAEIDMLDGRLGEISAELGEEERRKQELLQAETEKEALSRQRSAQEKTLQGYEKLEVALKAQRDAVNRMELDLLAIQSRKEKLSTHLHGRSVDIQTAEELLRDEEQIEKDFSAWEAARKEKEDLEKLATRYRHLETQQQEPLRMMAAAKARLEQELASLETEFKKAPAIRQELETLGKTIPELKVTLDNASAIMESRPLLDAELRNVNEEKARLEAENKSLKGEMDELRERIKTLQAAAGADCPLCGQELSSDHRVELTNSLEREGIALKETYLANNRLIAVKTEEKASLENRLKECDQAARAHQQGLGAYNQATARQVMLEQQRQELDVAQKRMDEIQPLLASGKYAQDVDTLVKKLAGEMIALGFDPDRLETVSLLENRLRPVIEKRNQIGEAKARLEPMLREKISLENQVQEIESEAALRESEFEKARHELEEQSAGLPDLNSLRAELDDLKAREVKLIGDYGKARQNVLVLDKLRERQTELNTRRVELTTRVARYKILERAFGKDGVQALLIEEALPEIETHANEILDRLSGGNMSVQFATQKEYKDKNRDDKRETLDILISDGAGSRVYELFSGGEAFRVNFAIRLALSRVLAHRAGARLQTLVIDEGFGSQDVDGRQRLIETINMVQPDFKKILVITHLEELKEAFPARIEVEKNFQSSRVTVA
ncbi:MAG: SMC family ATPase [Leptolinea sp.]|nr:SMC family ATPase [Leptolinea sp.]